MKFYQFFLIIFMLAIPLSAKINHENSIEEKTQTANLQATCTIKILKAKLKYAHNNEPINNETIINTFKDLYDQCSSVINTPENSSQQPNLTENEWIYKSQREIHILRHDDETRNCASKAMSNLQELQNAQSQDEKDSIIKNFMQNIENCSYQHALRVSLPHLEAQIQRWESNKKAQEYDFTFFNFFIKHCSDEHDDIIEDLQKIYSSCEVGIPFEQFAIGMQKQLNRIKNDQNAQQCLELLVKFKFLYDEAQTEEEKNNLKKAFAIRYLQCKNK